MTEKIIDLLSSKDLKKKLCEVGHTFSDGELLQIIYNYAPTFDEKIRLLNEFASEVAERAPDFSALAREYIRYEKRNLEIFTREEAGFIYDLRFKETPNSAEEKYICASFGSVLRCIDEFYKEYESVGARERERTRYTVKKRKIFFEDSKFEEDEYAECVLGKNRVILELTTRNDPAEDCGSASICSDCNRICAYRCDELLFPCFAEEYDILKYRDDDGRQRFGVTLFLGGREELGEDFYVIPLDCATIREHNFDDDFTFHTHISYPLAELATPEELDETTRENYFQFVEYRKQKDDEE